MPTSENISPAANIDATGVQAETIDDALPANWGYDGVDVDGSTATHTLKHTSGMEVVAAINDEQETALVSVFDKSGTALVAGRYLHQELDLPSTLANAAEQGDAAVVQKAAAKLDAVMAQLGIAFDSNPETEGLLSVDRKESGHWVVSTGSGADAEELVINCNTSDNKDLLATELWRANESGTLEPVEDSKRFLSAEGFTLKEAIGIVVDEIGYGDQDDIESSYCAERARDKGTPAIVRVFDLDGSPLALQNGITHMAEGPSKAEAFGLTPSGEIKKYGRGASRIIAQLDNAGGALSKADIDAGSDGVKVLFNVAASVKVQALVQSAGLSAFRKLEHGVPFTQLGINGSADQSGSAYKKGNNVDGWTVDGMDKDSNAWLNLDPNSLKNRVLMTPEAANAWEGAMQAAADKSDLTLADYKTANTALNDQVLAASAVVKGVPTPFDPETGLASIDLGRAGKLTVELNGGDMLDVSFSKGGQEFARKEDLVSINQVQPTVGGVMGGRASFNELLVGLVEATVEGKTLAAEISKSKGAAVAAAKPAREKVADKGR